MVHSQELVEAFLIETRRRDANRWAVWNALVNLTARFIRLEVPAEHRRQMASNFADEVRQLIDNSSKDS